jgi:formylglycine-generating enzyme required for sulfatase activity
MAVMITIEGIDRALSDLQYLHKNTLKARLLSLVRKHYDGEGALPVHGINRDDLIKSLWELPDEPGSIKDKRRQFSSLKSAVNKDLKELYGRGLNPEGIVLGPDNLFALCDDAKNRILEDLSDAAQGPGGANLDKVATVLEVVKEILGNEGLLGDAPGAETQEKLTQLKGLLHSLAATVGLESGTTAEDDGEETARDEPMPDSGENADLLEGDEPDGLEEVEEDAIVELVEEEDDLDETELIEVAEEEDLFEPNEPDALQETEEDAIVELVEEDDDLDETELIEVAEEEDLFEPDDGEEYEASSAIEPLEIEEETDEDLFAEEWYEAYEDDERDDGADEQQETGGIGLPLEGFGEPAFQGEFGTPRKLDEAKLLAEEFDGYLGTMDRYYNHYILIPDGAYLIGSKSFRKDCVAEKTVHLESFYMGRFPVTNALFEIFVDKTGYKTTAEKRGYGTVYQGRYAVIRDAKTGKRSLRWQSAVTSAKVEGACWFQPSGPQSTLHNKRNHPVVQVSLEDAMAFAAWSGKRLPSEEEWEAAARTADGHPYPWGDAWKENRCNLEESREGDTSPVDKYASFANALEIADTLGNVLEWTLNPELLSRDSARDGRRVAKGGSWAFSCRDTLLCSRFLLTPDSHSNMLGFRCVGY